eukprot:8840108-Pyramimonas_sp.AAC.1
MVLNLDIIRNPSTPEGGVHACTGPMRSECHLVDGRTPNTLLASSTTSGIGKANNATHQRHHEYEYGTS